MNVHVAASVQDALAFKARHPKAVPLLGGTDLLVQWQAGAGRPEDVLALEPVDEIRRIDVDDAAIVIGAGVTHHALAHDALVQAHLPALAGAARTVGAPAIQMMGTIGGNLANASPAADLPPALLVYDAEVVIASTRATRRVALPWFFTAYRRVDLAPDELIVAVRVPVPRDGAFSAYYKVGTRAAQSIARVGLAGCAVVEHGRIADLRLAAASMAPTPVRLPSIEDLVRGRDLTPALAAEARTAAASALTPIDDVRASAAYRRHAIGALVERFLLRAGA